MHINKRKETLRISVLFFPVHSFLWFQCFQLSSTSSLVGCFGPMFTGPKKKKKKRLCKLWSLFSQSFASCSFGLVVVVIVTMVKAPSTRLLCVAMKPVPGALGALRHSKLLGLRSWIYSFRSFSVYRMDIIRCCAFFYGILQKTALVVAIEGTDSPFA